MQKWIFYQSRFYCRKRTYSLCHTNRCRIHRP